MINILVLEDDAVLNKSVCTYLNDSGFSAKGFLKANDAYGAMNGGMFDLIISDIMMPGMDGPEVFRRIQEDERTQGIPVFFMTAVTDRDRVLECMEMNPEEYLVKPVSSSKLLKKLSDLFEKES